jgi:TatD DNase family protein
MNIPQPDDFINIHTHNSLIADGVFAVENLMAHENLKPDDIAADAFTAGIHPWYLNEHNGKEQIGFIRTLAGNSEVIAIGEAGFDKLRGPSMEIQRAAFKEQVKIAEEAGKPLIVHCVRAWDELLASYKTLDPVKPWLVHGFRGKKDLALQLISKGMYLSFWFDFVLRPESADLLRFVPNERIFLETDGADVSITDIYRKVANDLAISIEELKRFIFGNFMSVFN